MLPNIDTIKILTDAFSAAFTTGLEKATDDYNLISTTIASRTNINTYAWLGAFPRMREWIGDRIIQGLDGKAYTLTNRDWELTLGVPTKDIEDDQFGLYAPVAEEIGMETKTHKTELVFDTLGNGAAAASLCYDGKPFFATDHPVGAGTAANKIAGAGAKWYLIDDTRPLKPIIFQSRKEGQLVSKNTYTDDNVFFEKKAIWGVDHRYAAGYGFWQLAVQSAATLDEAGLAAARKLMRRFTDDKGRPLNIRPTLLVVPPELELEAMKLINLQTVANGGENVMRGAFKLHVTPFLSGS